MSQVPAYSPVRWPDASEASPLLYYITDRRQFPGDEADRRKRVVEKIMECGAAGVDYIQLREKDLSGSMLEELAMEAIEAISPYYPTKLLINSRSDIALASGAHGVHLPANDLPASEARVIFARAGIIHPVIGVSVHSAQETAYAEAHGADFAVFGPVFEKEERAAPHGLEQLRSACHRPGMISAPMPVLALGGVTVDNAAACRKAGAAGIAGIRLFQENNVANIVRKLKSL
ncbi:MAG TPA: thiamine phosphate synthase [Candidatus Angelobacter sp.]|nr:thiamine phosphate synthase [Candidatus Angelobacter sp.]